MKTYSIILGFVFFIVSTNSCNQNESPVKNKPVQKEKSIKLARLQSPERGAMYTLGDQIPVSVSLNDTVKLDSALVYFRGKALGSFSEAEVFQIPTGSSLPGSAGIRVKLYFEHGQNETHSLRITLNSDIVPKAYRYRLINTYPHDENAYTQGLQFYKGWMYEGTGNKNQSTVRKVRLENGEVIQYRNNASDIFGEGITIYNGRIYQLTYKAQVCFIYDLNTLEEIQKVYYQNKEGWGLTNNGSELIMSDGTHIIYFMDPDLFTVNRQIEVFDHNGPVSDLNELEYIKGKIYANRYFTDEIVIINPDNGKVEGRADLKGILPVKDRKPSTNVLNGIAWDDETDRLFVTGKYWPRLYEIKLKPLVSD